MKKQNKKFHWEYQKGKNKRICKYCGKVFYVYTYDYRKRKFCSMECYHKSCTNANSDKWEIRTCPTCGKKIKSYKSNPQKYCSVECQYYNRSKVILKKSDYKTYFKSRCVVCGKLIPKTWAWYQVYGNYCAECSRQAERESKITIIFAKLDLGSK